jgi:hypothetical protein
MIQLHRQRLAGANIPGDAANEPSIAVDPTNHDRMVIGWRQFDTIASNFRQAGVGYSTDGGATWVAGKIEPGVFRSDPVLDVNAAGRFFYNSLLGNLTSQVFPSSNGGASWGTSTYAHGRDKDGSARAVVRIDHAIEEVGIGAVGTERKCLGDGHRAGAGSRSFVARISERIEP